MADINKPAEFLSEALNDVKLLEEEKAKLEALTEKQEVAEKELSLVRKALEKDKNQTVKSRRSDIEGSFDKQLKKIDSDIKNVSEKRNKARSTGVKKRIEDQTSEYRDDIKRLKALIKDNYKKDGISQIYNNKLFYSLYMPHGAGEWITAVIAFVVVFCLIPVIIINMQLVKNLSGLYIFIVYTLDILIFGSIYIFIGNRVRIKHNDVLKVCRGLMDDINKDKKRIRKIMKQIKRDKDDSLYDLGAFDDELTQHHQKRETVNIQKDEAINKFDAVTKQVLIDEIETRYIDELAAKTEQLEQLKADIRELNKSIEQKTLYINDSYGQYIGIRNLESEKIAKMLTMIDNKEVGSISEAVSEL